MHGGGHAASRRLLPGTVTGGILILGDEAPAVRIMDVPNGVSSGDELGKGLVPQAMGCIRIDFPLVLGTGIG